MRQRRIQLAVVVAVVAIASVATVAVAGGGKQVREKLTGDEEVPVVLTGAEGKFKATLGSDQVDYELRYEDLEGTITQAHIHIGQRFVAGGITLYLCTNLAAPTGVPAPPSRRVLASFAVPVWLAVPTYVAVKIAVAVLLAMALVGSVALVGTLLPG